MKPLLVAEIKPRDPFTGAVQNVETMTRVAETYGDIISIHTHAAWDGSLDFMRRIAFYYPEKPILAKGAHMFGFEVEEALEAGATYVLTMNRDVADAYPDVCWYEGFGTVTSDVPRVINARNLVTGELRTGPATEPAAALRHHRLVQASGLRTPADIKPWAWAVLVGTHLRKFTGG